MANPYFVASLALLVVVILMFLPRWAVGQHPLVGKPAPDFTLEVVHQGDKGARMQLSALKGQAVILDFWATWCGPCRMEAPILSRIADKYKGKGLTVLGVNTDSDAELPRLFAQQRKLSYPIVFDAKNEASRQYGVNSLPTLVLVGRDGKILAVRSGLVDEGSLDEMIAKALL
jgi:cytochrome c biogenesis protein CcmG, thiol:disulfide interchange protein DsbE